MTLRTSALVVVVAVVCLVLVTRCGPDEPPPPPAPTPPPQSPPPPPPPPSTPQPPLPDTGRLFSLAYAEPDMYIDGRPLTNLAYTKATCRSLGTDRMVYEVIVPASSSSGGADVAARFFIDPFPFPGIECWATAHTPHAQSAESEHVIWDGSP